VKLRATALIAVAILPFVAGCGDSGAHSSSPGAKIFASAGCGSCHTLGKAGTNGNIGPSLDDLAQAAGQREPGTSAEDYVRQSILDPEAFTVKGFQKGVMPSFKGRLDDKQVQALVDYLLGR
jgi:cytochrome c oxidase subunit 2